MDGHRGVSASDGGWPRGGPAPGAPAESSGFGRLVARHLVIPVVALVVVIAAAVIAFAVFDRAPVINRASDSELCSAYRSAERSWDSYSTDATEIVALAEVAKRHGDEDIRAAGRRLDDLTGMFSYSTYESIVRPIEYQC